MSERERFEELPEIEPERYELHEAAAGALELARREFFGLLGAGLVVLLLLDRPLEAQEDRGRRRGGGRGRFPAELGAWIHIGEDGGITAHTGKVEVGQGIRTSLAQVVAEELRAPLESVRMVMGDTALTPFDPGTFGSQSTPAMGRQLARAAAATREALLDLAVEELKVERAALTAESGKVLHPPSGRSVPYGSLTRGRKLLQAISDDVRTSRADEWKVAGQAAPRAGGREIVTGAHRYSSDIALPGMLHGRVLRPPAFGATLASLDSREAEALPGVVVLREGDFAAVAATSRSLAARALRALRAEWKGGGGPSGKELFELLRKSSGEGGGREGGGGQGRGGQGRDAQTRGSIEEGLAAAEFKLEAVYTLPYIAHAPLEPRAAVAEWKEGKLTVWTGTQRPFGVRGELARAVGLPEDSVRVVVPDTGSGYGGKHTGEAAVEAARLARAAGKPVKVVWSREEEFTWAYFRPAGVIEVKSGARKDGTLTAWEFHNYNSGGSSIRTPYEVPHQRIQFHSVSSPLRQGSYRALAATANHFARECHMDELARRVGLDPLEFRRRNLREPRLLAVLEAAAERFGWTARARAPGRGAGLAVGTEKGSFVSTCAEVAVEEGGKAVRVLRLTTAFECGAVVNPDLLRSQVEGSVVMGLGGALFEAIEFEGGQVLNARFSRYRVPRLSDLPVLETVLLDRKDLPSAGAGETPIVCVAPAVANAILDATGAPRRALPLLG